MRLRIQHREPRRRRWADVCLSKTATTTFERQAFAAYHDSTDPIPVMLWCRLPLSHGGPHTSDAISCLYCDTARWLRWDGRHREVFDARFCYELSHVHEYGRGEPDWCQLHHGHEGVHSFVYVPPGQWPQGNDARASTDTPYDDLHGP